MSVEKSIQHIVDKHDLIKTISALSEDTEFVLYAFEPCDDGTEKTTFRHSRNMQKSRIFFAGGIIQRHAMDWYLEPANEIDKGDEDGERVS